MTYPAMPRDTPAIDIAVIAIKSALLTLRQCGLARPACIELPFETVEALQSSNAFMIHGAYDEQGWPMLDGVYILPEEASRG